jgi:catechol 2,3-dioxygenase-like lactoylglutathione lyase family enzyme
MITGISAITLATHDMRRAVRFYRELRFEMLYGGADASFTSFRAGPGFSSTFRYPFSNNVSLDATHWRARRRNSYG